MTSFTDDSGKTIEIEQGNVVYEIKLASSLVSVKNRRNFLGHRGLATIEIPSRNFTKKLGFIAESNENLEENWYERAPMDRSPSSRHG